jgi:integrase
MKATISQALIKALGSQDLTVFDIQQRGLMLRLRASGVHSYRVDLGRGRVLTLGAPSDALTPTVARAMASAKRGEQDKFEMGLGPDPMAVARRKRAASLATFLDDHYAPWAAGQLKHHAALLSRIRSQFLDLFGAKPLTEITPFAIERWRTARLKGADAVTKATANRDLAALKACLSKAVQWGILADHPLRSVKLSKEDRGGVVRYLTPEEDARLRAALTRRDDHRRALRASANEWRRSRGYPLLPDYGIFTDHLTPFVLLALNTGCRRGELFNLRWRDVDLVAGVLTVRGEGVKSGRTRHIPLSDEAKRVLCDWPPQAGDLVFPAEDGDRLTSLKTAWLKLTADAKLENFRLHDLRHSFASNLVQRGVDLNTVRELLGHSDFSLTLRYAHWAAENKAAAVAKLNSPSVTVPGVQQPAALMATALPLAMKPGTTRP